MNLLEIISALKAFKIDKLESDKAEVEAFFSSLTKLTKTRSVFVGTEYVFRFSQANYWFILKCCSLTLCFTKI